jgi:trimethylamine--corrinoid protein Co-methyltransferase
MTTIRGCLSLFEDNDLARLDRGVREVLQNVGLWIQCNEVLVALEKFGADVDRAHEVVKIPENLIDEVIGGQRKSPWRPRREDNPPRGEYAVGISGQVGQFYYDFAKKERRPGNRADFLEMIHFGDALDQGMSVSTPLVMTEMDPRIEAIEALALTIEHARKPGSAYAMFAEQIDYIASIGEAYANDRNLFAGFANIWMVSPLRMDRRHARLLVKFLRDFEAQPVVIGSMVISGGTSPVTAAGSIVVAAAEILGGWITAKALNPNAEIVGGTVSGVLDMKTAVASLSAPEAVLQDLGVCELFRRMYGGHVNVACWSDYTDAKVPGLQAEYERTFKAMAVAAVTGDHFNRGTGLIDSGKLFSPEQLILDQETGSALWKFSKGIEVTDETMALNVIEKVGLGRETNYLQQRHTVQNFRRAQWYSSLFQRAMWDEGKGSQSEEDVLQRAHERFLNALSGYVPPEIDKSTVREVRSIVENARKALLTSLRNSVNR